MPNFKVGQKILLMIVATALLFIVALSFLIGSSVLTNLTTLKGEELERTSTILAGRIAEMERNAVLTVRSFEDNEQIVKELQLLTDLGPYYADPGSYFGADFQGQPIEDADKIYVFQSQLNLIEMLRSTQRINDLTSISFYMISPFDVVADARPVLAFRLDQEQIDVAQFGTKGDVVDRVFYQVPAEAFAPPAPDYFDISSAYSAPPAQFYAENGFEQVTGIFKEELFSQGWTSEDAPRSQVILRDGLPVIQTWYPVRVLVPHPDTWVEEPVAVGLAVVEQELGPEALALLRDQLGLDLGIAWQDQLIITSLDGMGVLPESMDLGARREISLGGDAFNLARKEVPLLGLEAVVLSPVSELQGLVGLIRVRIGLAAAGAVMLIGFSVYLSIRYLINRPLEALAHGVQRIAAGDLDYEVPIRSRDEMGQLAAAFNSMADRLQGLVGSLEQKVVERTGDLEERARQLQAAAELGRTAAVIRDLDPLLTQVTRLIGQRFDCHHVGVFLTDEMGQYAELRATNSLALRAPRGRLPGGASEDIGGQDMLGQGYRLRVGEEGLVGYVAGIRQPRIELEIEPDAFTREFLPETRSEMALPLVAGDRLLGVLDVHSTKEKAFTPEDIPVFQVIADQLAVAIENAHLFSQLQQALEAERRAYGQVSRQAWAQMFRARPDIGYLCDLRGTVQVASDLRPEMLQARQTGAVVQDSGPTVVIPLKVRDQVIGVIRLRKPEESDVWTDEELELVQTLSDQLGLALEGARLYQDSQRRAEREQLVGAVTARMRETLDVEGVLRTAVQEMGQALGLAALDVRLDVNGAATEE